MANTEVRVAASGSYKVHVDSDGDEPSAGSRALIVDHHGGGSGNELFKVNSIGSVTVYGPIHRNATIHTRRAGASGTDKIVSFRQGGTEVASVNDGGVGVFAHAVKLRVVTSDPNGSLSGQAGQLILFEDSGDWYFCQCTGGTTWKKSAKGV